MLKLNIPNLEAIRNWCNEKFQPKGNYITKSEISNEVNETEITLSDLSETVPEAISAMSEEKQLKNLLSHIKAFMTGSKALIDLCVTTGMITQQNINDENKIPSAALLYSLNDALNGQVAQINSNLLATSYTLWDRVTVIRKNNVRIILFCGADVAKRQTLPIVDCPPFPVETIVWVDTTVTRLELAVTGSFAFANTSGYVRSGNITGQLVYKVAIL